METNHSAGSGPAEDQVIRVIEVRRHLTDPTTAGQEELFLILEAAREVPALANSGETLRAFLDIARTIQGPLAPLLAPPATEVLDSLLARDAFANPAVRPIYAARGAAADAERAEGGPPHIRTRAATRVRAISDDGYDAALATEEPAEVVGFAIDPLAAGSAIIAALGSGALLGVDVYAQSGAFPAAVLAAAGPAGRVPEHPLDPAPALSAALEAVRRRGFAVIPVGEQTADAPQTILLYARAAVAHYLSGAAATAAALRLAAAYRGDPAAPPELLAAVGPVTPALSDAGGIVVTGAPRAAARPSWRDPDDEERLRYLLGRLAKTEPVAAEDPGTWVFTVSPLNDLFRVGAFSAYLFILTEGRESARLDSFLELSAIRHAKATQLEELARRATAATGRARLYVSIVEDKFGAARGAAVLDALRAVGGSRARGAPGGSLARASDSVQVDDPDAVLAVLTAREREVVAVEYENRRAEWEAAVNNRCPHVRIARRLRAATSAAGALAALRELEKYIDAGRRKAPAGPPQWLTCRNCGFRVICPHVRDRVVAEARRAPYDEVRTRLLKYAVRIQAGEDLYTYYCRICSERLAEFIEEDRTAEVLGRFGDLDAGLRTKVWTVALNAARHVRFPTPTDEKQFASVAAVVVYPLLMAAEEAVAKKGRRRKAPRPGAAASTDTGDDEDIDPRTQLYIILFVYAYVLCLVRNSAGMRGQEVGFTGVKIGAKEGAYAEQMLRLIAEEHRGLLTQIEDITPEYVKARFIEAYRLVRADNTGVLVSANPEEELAVQATTIDPIYRYAAAVARVAGDLPLARAAGPAAARREFETALGAGLPAIVKQARESARDPALAPLYLRRAGAVVPPGGEALEFLVKGQRVNLYANMYEPGAKVVDAAALKSFRAMAAAAAIRAPGIRFWVGAADKKHPKHAKHAKHVKHTKPRAAAHPENELAAAERGYFFEAYRLFVAYTKEVTSQAAFDAYLSDLAVVRRSEDGLRVARALGSLKTYYDYGFARTQQHAPVDVPITTLYDENGVRHDWSRHVTYYYRPADGAAEIAVEGGPGGVKKAIDAGELGPDARLADLECPVCHTRMSRIADLDAAKAWQSLRAVFEIDSFFMFYESRCPAGELHDWAGGAQCSKCGLESPVKPNSKEARAYYDKYSARFAQEKREARERVVANVPPAPPPAVSPAAAETAQAWKPDYTMIVRAAELAGVSPAVIEAIGSMEGREYADIAEGRGAPPPPSAPSDPRIYTANAEVRVFLSDYGILRHYTRIRRPPPAITDLLAAAEVPKHEFANLADALPDVGANANYNAVFAAVLSLRAPADAQAFAIQSLCQFALEIAGVSAGPDWARRLGSAFAAHELGVVLRNQKLFSKPGAFNWAIFETGDDIIPDQVGDVGEDVLEELLGNEAEEAPDDPFSGENMDYDTSENEPNNEPA